MSTDTRITDVAEKYAALDPRFKKLTESAIRDMKMSDLEPAALLVVSVRLGEWLTKAILRETLHASIDTENKTAKLIWTDVKHVMDADTSMDTDTRHKLTELLIQWCPELAEDEAAEG